MKKIYAAFYKDLFKNTGGFISSSPLNQNMFPGDFFQIRNNEIVPLGNIYLNQLISLENAIIGSPNKLNEANWSFDSGVTSSYSNGGNLKKQTLAFQKAGSFQFSAQLPESIKIDNWNMIKDELIIKLTQSHFSFREVYVVTESATAAPWALAVAETEAANLELATEEKQGSSDINLFDQTTSKVLQSVGLEYYHREHKRKPNFFKAKKLVVQEEIMEKFINDLATQRAGTHEWASTFYDYDIEQDNENSIPSISSNAQVSVLDLLQSGELNPNTALQYFKWADANLGDVEQLLQSPS